MKAIEIKPDIYWTGVKDWNLTDFHGYKTPRGSTYNSYLIMDEKPTIIDGAKIYLSNEMIERVKSVTDFSKIQYIVSNHIEMDHSGNIPELKKLAPQAKVVTDMQGKATMENYFDTTGWEFIIVKTGDKLNIGKRDLVFMTTPMLHWPDSMMTYSPFDKVLFSNDGFGQHYAAKSIWAKDEPWDVVLEEAKKYYANILFPYGNQAEKALKDAHDLGVEIDLIANGHGCIYEGEKEVSTILGLYKEWAENKNNGSAVVVYDSMWGSTAMLAEAAMAEFQDQGIPVVKRNLADIHYSEVIVDVRDAQYVVVGNPTLNNQLYPKIAEFMTYMRGLQPKNKKGFAFGSYGWKPGIANQITDIMNELGWQTLPVFDVKYKPKPEDLQSIRQRVRDLISL